MLSVLTKVVQMPITVDYIIILSQIENKKYFSVGDSGDLLSISVCELDGADHLSAIAFVDEYCSIVARFIKGRKKWIDPEGNEHTSKQILKIGNEYTGEDGGWTEYRTTDIVLRVLDYYK